MMTTREILLVAGMAAVTFLVRYPVLALVSRITLPQVMLAAIIAPAMFMPAGSLDLGHSNAYLVAGLAAGLIAWRWRNLLATIVLGMAIFLFWRWLW